MQSPSLRILIASEASKFFVSYQPGSGFGANINSPSIVERKIESAVNTQLPRQFFDPDFNSQQSTVNYNSGATGIDMKSPASLKSQLQRNVSFPQPVCFV